MIIRRIYPNYQEVQVSLIGRGDMIWDDDQIENKGIRQKWFIDDVKRLQRAIKTIYSEQAIFGFDDFEPEKEKVEKEWKLGLTPKNIFVRKRSTENK